MALVRVRNSETGEVLDIGEEWAASEPLFESVKPETPLGLPRNRAAEPDAPTSDTADEPRRRSSF